MFNIIMLSLVNTGLDGANSKLVAIFCKSRGVPHVCTYTQKYSRPPQLRNSTVFRAVAWQTENETHDNF